MGDHITFISSDLKHDVPFVEFCNDLLHEYYKSEGYNITHDIEYNDGCSSQFKCIKAFSSLARRNTTRIFCETSHGKSKSDGLGGVIKSFVYCDVCGSEKCLLFEMLKNFMIIVLRILQFIMLKMVNQCLIGYSFIYHSRK